ncbi:hypothetical protein ACIGQ5_22470 [Peribacillus frigoritolerans]|uniref:hypothetical protein n=1 Tax=Peribacillus frigoritolerans TaxID=450367 RepID=UPI0037C7C068
MNITIKVYLHVKETNFYQSGSFPVLNSDFKKDPDWTAAIAAYEWIQQINKNMGDSVSIVQVFYNEENDITELVKKVRPII